MNKKKFDMAISGNLKGKTGYKIVDSRGETIYTEYYSKEEFEKFKEKMEKQHFDAYSNSKGSELEIKINKNGKSCPPKMASAASSSRFCYTALVNGALPLGVKGSPEFEHECRITGICGTAPQLDAYFDESNTYFEVKCHEIFDEHKIEFREAYFDILTGQNSPFGFSADDIELRNEGSFTFSPAIFGVTASFPMLDIKQLVCHLLGIRSQNKNGQQAKLIYLFFYPISDDEKVSDEIKKLFDDLENEINAVFNSSPIKKFCNDNNIVLEAYAEKSTVMTALNSSNVIKLY